MAQESKGSVVSGMLWMFFISILLFWLPGVGSLIAGIVGGKKAGGVGNAILAVFLPGIILGVILFLLSAFLVGIPLIGIVAGAGGFALTLVHIGPLIVGAIIGGVLAK